MRRFRFDGGGASFVFGVVDKPHRLDSIGRTARWPAEAILRFCWHEPGVHGLQGSGDPDFGLKGPRIRPFRAPKSPSGALFVHDRENEWADGPSAHNNGALRVFWSPPTAPRF